MGWACSPLGNIASLLAGRLCCGTGLFPFGEHCIFDVIPIGSRIIEEFIGRSMEKSCIILIIILKIPIRWFIMDCLIGVFCWKFVESAKKYL